MSARYFVGIDLGSRFHQAAVVDDQGHRARPSFRIGRGRNGVEQLLRTLAVPASSLVVSIEATANYWPELVGALTRRGSQVYQSLRRVACGDPCKSTGAAECANGIASNRPTCLGSPTAAFPTLWVDRDQGSRRSRRLFQRLRATDNPGLLVVGGNNLAVQNLFRGEQVSHLKEMRLVWEQTYLCPLVPRSAEPADGTVPGGPPIARVNIPNRVPR